MLFVASFISNGVTAEHPITMLSIKPMCEMPNKPLNPGTIIAKACRANDPEIAAVKYLFYEIFSFENILFLSERQLIAWSI